MLLLGLLVLIDKVCFCGDLQRLLWIVLWLVICWPSGLWVVLVFVVLYGLVLVECADDGFAILCFSVSLPVCIDVVGFLFVGLFAGLCTACGAWVGFGLVGFVFGVDCLVCFVWV